MFIRIVHSHQLKTAGWLLALLGVSAALLIWPQAAASGVSRGLSICSTVIIPSLFPFLVVSGFLVRSGISAAIGRRLEGLTRRVFRLPGCCATGILIGFIGGYPTGAVAVRDLLEQGQITPAQARRMLRFCVCGGPAFIISAVGAGMMGSVRYGVVLYAAHIAAALIIALGERLFAARREEETPAGPKTVVPKMTASASLVESVNASCRLLLYMCGFVVLFAALLALLDVSGLGEKLQYLLTLPLHLAGRDAAELSPLLSALLEVSCGCVEISGTRFMAPLLFGMALGWGGLSVHCQIAASLHGRRLITRSFFLARLLHALLGGLLTQLLMRFIPMPVLVFNPEQTLFKPFTTSIVVSVAMLLMCSLLLLATSGRRGRPRLPAAPDD